MKAASSVFVVHGKKMRREPAGRGSDSARHLAGCCLQSATKPTQGGQIGGVAAMDICQDAPSPGIFGKSGDGAECVFDLEKVDSCLSLNGALSALKLTPERRNSIDVTSLCVCCKPNRAKLLGAL